MTALEITEGILRNEQANHKCLVFIRNNICLNNYLELKKKMKDLGYYNEDPRDNDDLDALKINVKKKLPSANVFELKVNHIFEQLEKVGIRIKKYSRHCREFKNL